MSKVIRKCFLVIFSLMMAFTSFGNVANANTINVSVGDYIRIGQYNGAPILWRCTSDDANGKLLLSDRILCYKVFDIGKEREPYDGMRDRGRGFWEESTLRAWLNSSASAGKVTWPYDTPPSSDKLNEQAYDNEDGFLNDTHFSQTERNLMKPVSQWTMLPKNKLSLSENGLNTPYNPTKKTEVVNGDGHGATKDYFWDISELPSAYYGAAYRIQDTVFLLDEIQLYNMWEKLKSVNTFSTNDNSPAIYWLRTASIGDGVTIWNGTDYNIGGVRNPFGVRPAFYLNETAVGDVAGSGTADDPYILTQNPDCISVLKDGQSVSFDVAPVIENDRVLVPFRAIFEAFGAEVGWNGDTSTVTATTKSTTLTLQIGCDEMTVNGETVTLDVPPQLVDDRTLVPIRAVSEGLGANVQWDDANKTVIITSK